MNAKVRALLVAGCTVSGLSAMGCEKAEPEQFGYTCVELQRGESVEDSPFLGTYKIIVTLNYEPCLVDYYLNKHPEMRQNGKDGPAVFAEWKDRLCAEDVTRRIECEVEGFDQILMQTGMEAYKMSVTYITPNPTELEGRKLLWGPGPTEDQAECSGDLRPYVNLSTLSGVIGQDKTGKTIWQVQSFGDKRGIMKLDAGGCIQANIQPVGG